jgi:hypothetical protein
MIGKYLLKNKAWPYVLDGRFHLFNPTWPRAYGFDQTGNLVARFDAPDQADSLEETLCLFGSMVQVDSLVGIYESARRPLKLYWPDGRFHSQVWLATQPDTGLAYCVNALDRAFGYLQGHFYNYAYPGAVNHDTRRFYTLPFFARHSRDGKQVVPFGERDSVYHHRFLPHNHEAWLAVDPYAGEILVGEEAASQMAVYDLQGNLQYRFGKPGKHIADQAFRDYQFEGEENSRVAQAYFLDLYFGTPGYSICLCAGGLSPPVVSPGGNASGFDAEFSGQAPFHTGLRPGQPARGRSTRSG